jgi:hypothetical protein
MSVEIYYKYAYVVIVLIHPRYNQEYTYTKIYITVGQYFRVSEIIYKTVQILALYLFLLISPSDLEKKYCDFGN